MTEQEYKEFIYTKAKSVKSKEDLNTLLDEIMAYEHDYGTIVYGLMAAIKSVFKVIDNSPQGGITGFQANCLAWECIYEFMMITYPAKIMDFNNLLYPQCEKKFEKEIPIHIWENLQGKARKMLEEEKDAHSEVVSHWQSIVDGKIPFEYKVKDE